MTSSLTLATREQCLKQSLLIRKVASQVIFSENSAASLVTVQLPGSLRCLFFIRQCTRLWVIIIASVSIWSFLGLPFTRPSGIEASHIPNQFRYYCFQAQCLVCTGGQTSLSMNPFQVSRVFLLYGLALALAVKMSFFASSPSNMSFSFWFIILLAPSSSYLWLIWSSCL